LLPVACVGAPSKHAVAELINAGVNLARLWLDIPESMWKKHPQPPPSPPPAPRTPSPESTLHTPSQPANRPPVPDHLSFSSYGNVASEADEKMAEDFQVDFAKDSKWNQYTAANHGSSEVTDLEQLLKDCGWSLCALLSLLAVDFFYNL
jgi:hypothetical protein